MKGQKNKDHNRKKRAYGAMCALCGVLFFCCLTWLGAYFIGLKRAKDEMDAVFDSYVSVEGTQEEEGRPESSPAPESMENVSGTSEENGSFEHAADQPEDGENPGVSDLSDYGAAERSIDWASLQEEKNKDIYGWIVVPGTVIDYPVLQHPEETDYYLEHNLDGSKGRPGCIYTQRMNSKDWSDRNTVLYGHNMRAGTMFAGLHAFEDADFFEENRYILIYSEDGRVLIYEIFAAYAFSDAHILMSYDFYTEEGYGQYLDVVRESAEDNGHFRQETAPGPEDKIITLSTCIRGSSSKRYLVQGVLIAEGEQP